MASRKATCVKFAKTCLAAALALGAAGTTLAAVVDLGGASVTKTGAEFKAAYNNNTIENGTVTVSSAHDNENMASGVYTIGNGATLTSDIIHQNGNLTLTVAGGTYISTGYITMPFRYGNQVLVLDNGVLSHTSSATASGVPQTVNIGYTWNNKDSSKGKDISARAVVVNGSRFEMTQSGNLGLGMNKAHERKINTMKVDFAVTNSTVFVSSGQIVMSGTDNAWISDTANSYVHAVFGPGADLTFKQIYANGSYPAPSAIFDGATIHWVTGGNSFIGQTGSVSGDIYEIQENGLTVDIPEGGALSCDVNSSALKGDGGIVKVGNGSITWNKITSSGSGRHLFTGSLVVSNGTWSSSVGYAASAFKVDGANSTLALSGSLTAASVVLAATDGGTLTLAGATLTDASPDLTLAGGGTTDYFTRDGVIAAYMLDSLTLGEGAVLDLDADATGADTISATTTNIMATAAHPVTINLNFTAAPAAGETFTFFATDDAAKFTVTPKLGSLTVPHEISISDGILVMTVTADDYTWNGSQTNWGDADAWTKDGAAATWADGNNAIFNTANTTAALAANAAASKVEFSADATVDGTATLTAPVVAVASGVSATISAPTAGALSKIGAGTLTLTQNRTDQTTLSEGTLAMPNGATLDPSKLTLGTDPAKPVTLDYGGQTLSSNPTAYLGAGMDVMLTNGTFSHTGEVRFDDSNSPSTLTIASNAVLSTTSRYFINTSGEKTINIVGGEFDLSTLSGSGQNVWLMQNSSGCLRINATDGAVIRANGYLQTASGHDSAGLSPKVDWVMVDSMLSITGRGLYLGNRGSQGSFSNHPVTPECRFSMTNGVFNAQEGIFLGNNPTENTSQHGGWYIAEFDNCIVTAKQCRVYGDRPASRIHFNGTTLVANGDGENWITATEFAEGATPVTIGADGLVLDTNGKTMSVKASLGGTGGLTVKGGGRVTMTVAPAYSGVTTVEAGTTLVIPSPDAFTGGFASAVAASATLPEGVYPYIVIVGEGTLPASVLEDLVAPEGCRFVRTGDGKTILCISGNPTPTWIGGATGSLSVDANWTTGFVPDSGACVIGNAMAASLEKGDAFAAESITFPADSASVTIAGDFTTLSSIVNNSTANMTFTGFVDFGNGNIDVTETATYNDSTRAISGGCVVFAGGVRGVDVANHTIFTGSYTLTKTGKFNFTTSGNGRAILNTNATLNVKSTDQIHELYIKSGATFHTETASHGWSGSGATHRLWLWNEGTFFADSYLLDGNGQMWLGGLISNATNADMNKNAVLKIETATVNSNGQLWLHGYNSSGEALTTYIGAGGLNIASGKTGYFGVENKNHTSTIRPLDSDFTIGRGSNANYDFRLANEAIQFAIHTTDEDETARTVTLNGRITTENHADTTITVKGTGTNVVNSTSPLMVGTYAVADTATVVLNNGAGFANGTISVGGTATLAVGESGTASVNNLTLAAGATLGFNFTERAAPPVLVATSATLPATVKVKVSAAEGKHVKGGAHVLTSGGAFAGANVELAEDCLDWVKGVSVVDGEIVIDVKAIGTIIIVR